MAIRPEMLGQLYRQHARALCLFARQWTDAAEDVVQEAFVKLARQANVPDLLLPWLYRVVRNEALQASRGNTRRRQREARVSTDEAWFARTDDQLDAWEATRLLAELPLEQREIIVARLWGGLTFEQIAPLACCSLA